MAPSKFETWLEVEVSQQKIMSFYYRQSNKLIV